MSDSATLEELREQIRSASTRRQALRIRGGGSKDFYGGSPIGLTLETQAHHGVVAYEPTELYVRARCGTRLAAVEAALDEANQMLAFEPPHFGGGATIGGAVATGLSGPRRAQSGALRDFVLGIEMLDGRAELLKFGGQVMKNVAGYDISRLVAGSLGTLGLITEVTLKVLPKPAAELSLRLAMDQARAIATMNEWGRRPLPISATLWHDGALIVRLSGAAVAVQAARTRIGGEPLSDVDANDLWRAVRDQTHPFFAVPLWRVSLPPTAPPLGLPGATLIEWNGGLRWLTGAGDIEQVRQTAAAAGGTATLFRTGRTDKRGIAVFHPLPPPLLGLHRRLKQTFDPLGIFNPGRMYDEL